jgi:Rod binding domain-containing protein
MIAPVSGPGTPVADDADALRQAAQTFEALILEQMLKATHPEAQGPEADARSLADQALARDLSAQSPFGIAALLKGVK